MHYAEYLRPINTHLGLPHSGTVDLDHNGASAPRSLLAVPFKVPHLHQEGVEEMTGEEWD